MKAAFSEGKSPKTLVWIAEMNPVNFVLLYLGLRLQLFSRFILKNCYIGPALCFVDPPSLSSPLPNNAITGRNRAGGMPGYPLHCTVWMVAVSLLHNQPEEQSVVRGNLGLDAPALRLLPPQMCMLLIWRLYIFSQISRRKW